MSFRNDFSSKLLYVDSYDPMVYPIHLSRVRGPWDAWERARAGAWGLGRGGGLAAAPSEVKTPRRSQRETRSFRDQTWCISRDQVREQLRYHHNDFLGRANAHHLAVRHSGPSPSKGPARRAPRFLLEFSRRPFTGPRLARPCARDKQGKRQTRARWSGAPAASLSVS